MESFWTSVKAFASLPFPKLSPPAFYPSEPYPIPVSCDGLAAFLHPIFSILIFLLPIILPSEIIYQASPRWKPSISISKPFILFKGNESIVPVSVPLPGISMPEC